MCKIICVTNRKLVSGDFLARIREIVSTDQSLHSLILREKDLSTADYEELAVPILALCKKAGVPCIFNSQPKLAVKLGADGAHLSIHAAKEMDAELKKQLPLFGVSTHSLEEAKEAESLGASYIFFGNVFETDCKKGLAGKGVEALMEICENVKLPVYAIGGINVENMQKCIEAGAAGVCMMSGLMKAL